MTFHQDILPFLIVSPPLFYGLFSLYCGHRFFSLPALPAGHCPPVTILKPVKGVDADSAANFASFCNQDYPLFQIVFAVASADDPVVPIIRELMAGHPAKDMELVIDDRLHGANYKVCNLMNAWPRAKYDIVIVCDSDIRVERSYLRQVCAHFADPEVGLVTSLYRSREIKGTATALEALGFSAEMVPNVMVALRLEGLSFALGASMAVRREALERIGGFAALVDYLADDYHLGNMVHRAGYRIALSGEFVESVMKREGVRGILSRQLRWARTRRVSRPAGYFASGVTQPAAMALLALLASGLSPAGWMAILLLGAVRASTTIVYSRCLLRDHLLPRWLWLLPLRDLLASVTWALSFLGNRVVWRGARFRMERGGKMVEIDRGR